MVWRWPPLHIHHLYTFFGQVQCQSFLPILTSGCLFSHHGILDILCVFWLRASSSYKRLVNIFFQSETWAFFSLLIVHTYALSRKASVCTGTEAGKGKSTTNVLHVVPEDRRLTHQSFTERAELGPRDGDGYPALLAWVAGKRENNSALSCVDLQLRRIQKRPERWLNS